MMELFNDADGKPTIAVNPACITWAELRSGSITAFGPTDGYAPDGCPALYPLDGETLEEAWARLTGAKPKAPGRLCDHGALFRDAHGFCSKCLFEIGGVGAAGGAE